jgi:lipopolysaccharide biosynthesis protein
MSHERKIKRVAVYAHFDAQNEVKAYVTKFLLALRDDSERVIFVSTAELAEPAMAKVRELCDDVIVRDNVGLDFAMWKDAIFSLNLGEWDELVLTNCTLFGPIAPLGPIFDRMTEAPCDFWAMTDNFEVLWHLQSYFLVFKRPLLQSDAFAMFWKSVLPYRDKGGAVMSYELGLTAFFMDQGFVPGCFIVTQAWASMPQRIAMEVNRQWNPTLFYPRQLIDMGFPFVKVNLLRDNVGRIDLAPVRGAMSAAGYDLNLIEFDRPPHHPRVFAYWRDFMRRLIREQGARVGVVGGAGNRG